MADLALLLNEQSQGTPEHHDLALSPSGDLVLTDGVDAVKQAVAQAIKQFTEDWFLDMGAGLPYKSQLFGGRDLSGAFEAVMQNRVLQVPGVLGLLAWQTRLDRLNRSLLVRLDARCTGGLVQWSFNVSAG